MVHVLTLMIVIVCFMIFLRTCYIWHLNRARRTGFYPPKDRATLYDVKRLLMNGEKDLAVRVYRDIYHTSAWEARKNVDELEKNLNNPS